MNFSIVCFDTHKCIQGREKKNCQNGKRKMEERGIDPLTSRMLSERSTI